MQAAPLPEVEVEPRELAVEYEGHRLLGPAAWEHLLQRHPSLKTLSWLAERLGLEAHTAASLHRGSHFLKRLCRRC